MLEDSVVYLTRKIHFCAAHRLHSKQLSDDENKKIFGKCNHINSHGHNYGVEVTVCGRRDPVSQMVFNAATLKDYMEKAIMDVMDHKCLDKDVDYFKESPSTAENIAVFIWNQLQPYFLQSNSPKLYKVIVNETENISATFKG